MSDYAKIRNEESDSKKRKKSFPIRIMEDCRSDDPEQSRAIGWIMGQLYSLIYEVREDEEGEYFHQVTLWKSTKEEQRLYEENS